MFGKMSCDFYFDAKVQAFINANRLCTWYMAASHITIDFFVDTFSGVDVIRPAIVNIQIRNKFYERFVYAILIKRELRCPL